MGRKRLEKNAPNKEQQKACQNFARLGYRQKGITKEGEVVMSKCDHKFPGQEICQVVGKNGRVTLTRSQPVRGQDLNE